MKSWALAGLWVVYGWVGFAPLAEAQERPKVYIKCVLRFSTLPCPQIRDTFYNDYASMIARTDRPDDANLELSLTDQIQDSNNTIYFFTWSSHDGETKDTSFQYPLVLSKGLDFLAAMRQVSLNAGKGLAVYLKINDRTINDDSMVLVFGRPSGDTDADESPWLDRLAKSPWFFSIPGNGSYVQHGHGDNSTQTLHASGGLEVGYFASRFKVDLSGHTSLTRQSVKSPQGDFSARQLIHSYTGLVVYTLTPNPEKATRGVWNVAVVNTISSDSGSNIDAMNMTQMGVEWTLVPFREKQNHEIAFRIGPEYAWLQLDQPNEFDHLSERYVGVFARVYYYWTTLKDKLIFSVSAGTEQNLKYRSRSAIGAFGHFNYQIARFVSVTGSVSRVYTKDEALYYPGPNAAPVENQLQRVFQKGQAGGNTHFQVGLSFNLGNTAKKQRDRRWLLRHSH